MFVSPMIRDRLFTLPRAKSCVFVLVISIFGWYQLVDIVNAQSGTGIPTSPPASTSGQPNVVVILTDDQGWGDLSFHGNTNLSTPNIDSIARVGVRFDRYYVCPVCSPTRAEFLTGRYHPRCGVRGVSEGHERMNLDERTIAQHFGGAGYATACYGKWHNGSQYPYHPLARGFQDFYGFCSGHWGDYYSPQLEHNGKLVQGQGYIIDDLTNHAIKFIESNAKDKFFLYLSLPSPHSPMQAPDRFWQRHKDRNYAMKARDEDQEDVNFTRAAMAMVESVDENVGRVLSKLDQLGISKQTIVVFFCDNGPNSIRWNADMKGRKGSTDEGGVRSPLFMSWPGKIEGGRLISQICGAIDLVPTLADLAGVPVVLPKPLDGVSLKPLLTGEKVSFANRMIFSHWNRQVSVRTQQYRLDANGQLFDMVADPGQRRNVAAQRPDIAKELQLAVAQYKSSVLGELSEQPRPFSVGHPDFHSTILPARDGVPHGNVQRSAKAPNCSYFTNWTSTDDSMTWLIDVLEKGRFEVEMHYACSESAVGTQIELSFAGNTTRAVVEKANDVPAYGAAHDLVPRKGESYVKNFVPLSLGTIELAQGVDQLKLQALHIAAQPAAEQTEPPGKDTDAVANPTVAAGNPDNKLGNETGVEVRMLILRRVP
jgi:arylsulfatase A-like enzyme